MNFYKAIETTLFATSSHEKIKLFNELYRAYKSDELEFTTTGNVKKLDEPSYATFCTVVKPPDVPKRKNVAKSEGQILLLHAVAHIEYGAIDLALDHLYRFQNMPKKYVEDWLVVADDEIRHFLMIETLLNELGANYGDIPVHNALFEALQWTQDSLLERMAVVPRYLEANGLDATPYILEKLKRIPKSEMIDKIISALEIILQEEVSHVLYGDRWFEYACEKEGMKKEIYFEIIEKHFPKTFPRHKGLNIQARQEAGFSCSELKIMTNEEVC